jgi:hypothetical protein
MLAGLAGTQGLSLEFVARPREIRFYLRAASDDVMDAAIDQLRAAYPQAGLRRLSLEERPYLDAAWTGPGETCSALSLHLTRDSALPWFTGVRTSDPLPGVLAASAGVTGAERVVSQLILAPAPHGWQERVQGSVETRPRYRREDAASGGTRDILPLMGLLGLGAVGLQGYEWYQEGRLLALAGLGGASLVGAPLAMALAARLLGGREPPPADLIEEKLAAPAFAFELRILAFGSAEGARKRLDSLTRRIASAYQAFDHPLGNGLRPHGWRGDPRSLHTRRSLHRGMNVLNAAELAVLWHLPQAAGLPTRADSVAHHVMPPQEQVARGCRVGASLHQGQEIAASIPHGLLFRNQLVVAKTRRGKSTLLIHLASYLMRRMADRRDRLLLVVVDPHQDLAESVLSAVPGGLDERVAYLNLASPRPRSHGGERGHHAAPPLAGQLGAAYGGRAQGVDHVAARGQPEPATRRAVHAA